MVKQRSTFVAPPKKDKKKKTVRNIIHLMSDPEDQSPDVSRNEVEGT